MVRRLIPAAAPGSTIEDLITARFDYNKLDLPNHPVRLRLNSSAVNAHNNTDGSVSVSYVTQGETYRVKGKHCIMACYNGTDTAPLSRNAQGAERRPCLWRKDAAASDRS